nr:penicillin-binding protein 1C [Chloroflexota bacterium]
MSSKTCKKRTPKCLLLALLTLIACAWGLRTWLLTDLPSQDKLPAGTVAPSTILYDRHGRVLYEIIDPHVGRHQPVPLAEIPLYLRQATVATEDASFYQNPGVDPRAIIRAIYINLRGGEVLSGGSTITQQLARNLLLSPQERAQRTLTRKLRESILAYRLARTFSKDQILELYLNQTYYGNLAYGVEAAARSYFGKAVRDLDLAECALLAGLPQAPATYDPLTNPQAAKNRQRIVLNLMVKNGYISAEQAAAASDEELAFAATPFSIRAPHFVMYVWEILRREYGEEMLYRRGLRVYTTLDVDLQDRARDIARYHLQQLAQSRSGEPSHNVTNAALVALDPHSGEILAMLGSLDYFDPSIDGAVNVALMPRQPGSAIKPLTYAAAFARDYTPATMLLDVRSTFITREGDAYVPVNYDRRYHGPVLLREALGSSLNVIAVKVLEHIGVPELVSQAQKLGLTTLQDPQRFGLALTLGGGEVRLLELTAAYAAFANGGLRVEPRPILRVEDASGHVLWTLQPSVGPRVLDERIAYWITDVLSDDSARIPAFGEGSALALSRPAAAKTGTTTDWRDNWTIGYTPDLVVGVWVGNANNSPMVNVSGISGAAPIWHNFMEEALKGKPVREFVRPSGMIQVEICADSGMLPNPYCPHRRFEWFIAGREPRELCSMHQLIKLDRRTNEPATADTPPEYVSETVGIFLPAEAAEWAHEQKNAFGIHYIIASSSSEASSATSTIQPGIILTSPNPRATYRLVPNVPAANQRIEISALPVGLPDLAQVKLYIDEQLWATLDQPPYAVLWPLQPGQHTFRAEAMASSGQTWHSPPVQITVLQ